LSSLGESQPKSPAKKGGKSRSYSDKTLKLLFALCRNQCAHPECTQSVIQALTAHSSDQVIGEICHIYAHSGKGPRGNPAMTDAQLREADNLMVFCPTHHAVIDAQHETYPASLLKQWKQQHERPYREKLTAKLTDIGFAELEVAAKALLAPSAVANGDYQTIPPAEKIEKNELGSTSTMLLTLGAAKSREVERVLLASSQLDSEFPDRLRSGFVGKYKALRSEGLDGDDLFVAMYEWAGGGGDKGREAAGLSILTHLFVICDVFEK
jgi:hypothetical protein